VKSACIFSLAAVMFFSFPVSATIINIPDDYAHIQQGINASSAGDTILVQPGTYDEEINISGTFVTLGSLFLTTGDESYVQNTAIQGNRGNVIRLAYCDFGISMIVGFQIQQGSVGVYCLQSNAMIAHNEFTGIENYGIFEDAYSAGIRCESANVTAAFNRISRVNSVSFGDDYLAEAYGIHCLNSHLALYNSVIIYTAATSMIPPIAVGFQCENSVSILWNNTIASNGNSVGGGIRSWDSETLLMNDVIWYNVPVDVQGSVTAGYCNTNTYLPGDGNIRLQPFFRNRENGDFHLMSVECGDAADSPCIDAGHPEMVDSLLDCSWGLGTSVSDMGAYGGGDSMYVGIDGHDTGVPTTFLLSQNYPNPFNSSTVISFTLREAEDVKIEIFDLLGRRVETLSHGRRPSGFHRILWNAAGLSSGIYVYRIKAGDFSEMSKMLLLR
jgi:hypothetical protein